MRYLLRVSGVGADKVRHTFFLMRREMLSTAVHDLGTVWHDPFGRLDDIEVQALKDAKRQMARSALKEMDSQRITGTDLTGVTSLIEVVESMIERFVERQRREILPIDADDCVPYTPWPAFDPC